MRLLFDLQALQNGSRARGIGRYVLSLLTALAQRPDIEVWGLLNSALREHLEDARQVATEVLGEERLLVFQGLADTARINEDNHQRRELAEIAYEQFIGSLDFDALVVGSLFEGFEDNTTVSLKNPDAGYRKYVILYDLIPLLNPDLFLSWHKIHDWYHDRLSQLECADALFAISDCARLEALEHLGRKPTDVVAIGTATDPEFFSPEPRPETGVRKRLGIKRPFVMHVSAFEERKNFAGLLRAFAKLPASLRQSYQLVFVGHHSPAARAQLEAIRDEVGVREGDLVFAHHVSDAELAELYRTCSLFVFPSFHEGFGLPALEAMSCGCPTIGSDRSSVPEVIGREDLLFDPSDPAAMAKLMGRLLGDPGELSRASDHALKHARTFSWNKVADRAAEAIGEGRVFDPPRHQPFEFAVEAAAKRLGSAHYDEAALAPFAQSLVRNQEERFRYHGRRSAAAGSTWRVEGPFDSSYSLALLNRETARALEQLGFSVTLHSTEGPGDFDANPAFLQQHDDLNNMHGRGLKQSPEDADVVSRILYPPRVADMTSKQRALHHYAWEESGFPQEWANDFNRSLTFMTCLSQHVEKLMIDNGVTVPMLTSGCGVDHWERVTPQGSFGLDKKLFKFLHVSSCFPRKGPDLLLAAYGAAFTSKDDVLLVIKTFRNPHNLVEQQLEEFRAANPQFPRVHLIVDDLSDGRLKALYQQCDVMVGPSCAEGYGLPFAEAMLSGLPVITTNWGGQLDFCNPGNSWLVDYEFEPARTHFELWGSVWARADVDALAQAMRQARAAPADKRRQMADRGRRQLLERHKWSDVATRLAAARLLLSEGGATKPGKIGWMTTWNSHCGIATYSSHLIKALGRDVTVFAPDNEEFAPDQSFVERSWSLGKTGGDYDKIYRKVIAEDLGSVVIQFNYNFFDHAELGRLIRKLQERGVAVVMFLHSTVDPVLEPVPELFHLSHFRDTLNACDRVLVHSVADLNRLKSIDVIDRVALIPHGVLEVAPAKRTEASATETIASYGFALPNKGLEELVDAVGLLHRKGRKVRLRLINAEHPAEVSREILEGLDRRVRDLGLEGSVERFHDFLPDDRSLELLQGADLAVFPYQHTGESASGAVRYGMAAQVPVATTPLPIFDDLQGATFRFAGTSTAQLAEGLERMLDQLRAGGPDAQAVQASADRWRSQHAYPVIANRLGNMLEALAKRRRSAKAQFA